jgi:hypothetical protein
MIKALLFIFEPGTAWIRVADARRGLGFIFTTYLLPMLLLVAVVEGAGMVKWGKWQAVIGQIKKFTVGEAVVFEAFQTLLMLVAIAACAHLIKMLGETFHGRHDYRQAFTAVIYGLSPLFMVRLLDAFPSVNPWLTWVVGILLVVAILYHGVPCVMLPDPPHALGLYFMSSILIVTVTGAERFATFWCVSGYSQPLENFIADTAAKLPF